MRLRRRMKTDSGASMPVSAFLRLKHRWALEHVHMFWSTIHYAGSCICLFVMSKYIAIFFFHGKLGCSKATLVIFPSKTQKHSGSLSHSSLASQIVKKKKLKKTKKKTPLYKHNMTTRPETKQKSETAYLKISSSSILWIVFNALEWKNNCSRCNIVIIFGKGYLELIFFALLTEVQSVKTSVVKRWLLFPSKQFRFGAMSLFWDLFELPHAHESLRHWEQQHNP